MEQVVSISITRRDVVAGLAVAAIPMAVLAAADNATAQEKSLYERLGGVFAIAAVIDHFSDEVVKNRKVGQAARTTPQLNEWSTDDLGRLPGLKFMRTLWGLRDLRRSLRILRHEAGYHPSRAGRGTPRPQDLFRQFR